MAQILVIEDNETMREGIAQILVRMGHEAKTAPGGRVGVQMFEAHSPDFVITDLKMEDMDGIDVLKKIRGISPDAPVMIMTAFGTIETAVDAMKIGAFDFITKPFSPDLLRVKVMTALDFVKTKAENRFLRSEIEREIPPALAGESPALTALLEKIGAAAAKDGPVFILGESGTGKELVARSIHARSSRSDKPFIKVDCAALAEGVLESELFGHERGAFPGANQRKPGRFELADGGTVYLQEAAVIPPALQTRIFRVLKEGTFERAGGTRTLTTNVRVIAGTRKDPGGGDPALSLDVPLRTELTRTSIPLPPLRERKDDLPMLIDLISRRFSGRHGKRLTLTPAAIAALKSYDWPGNLGELDHLLERFHAHYPGDVIDEACLPDRLRNLNNHVYLESPSQGIPLGEALERIERELILRAYKNAGGDLPRTAGLLGIGTDVLTSKLATYGRSGGGGPS